MLASISGLESHLAALYSISLCTKCEQGAHLKYRFHKRITPTDKAQIIQRLTTALRILPIITLLMLTTGGLFISSHHILFRQASNITPGIIAIATPAANASEASTFQLVASLSGHSPSSYDMFWYVDNGQWNWMSTTADNAARQASIDVSGWHWHAANDDYNITVVAVLHSGGQRVFSTLPIHVGNAVGTQPMQPTTKTLTSNTSMTTNLYVNPDSNAAQTAASTSDPTMKRVMTKLAAMPTAIWLGNWTTDVQNYVASVVGHADTTHQTPVFVVYNIPNRDCSGYSAGGASSPDAYKSWVHAVADGIGTQQAIVVLEPDALAQIDCLNASDLAARNQLLSFAITTFKSNAGTKVYLDAGNPSWVPATTMAPRLRAANIAQADGFSLNVSNFIATNDNITYGTELSKLIGNKHFVIDTSRNGNGSNGEWCNPSGRALGKLPSSNTGNPLVDYFLWVKTPGESDGACNGGPAAGIWWPAYAESLATNAGW